MKNEIGINQLKRRDFLRAGLVFGAGAAGLAAGYAAVPDAFARAVYAAKQEGITNDNVLVMIQLAGGNDGLRTLVPLADPTLHDLRPKLAAPMVSQALPLNSDFGLNHNLDGHQGPVGQGQGRDRAGRRLSEPDLLALRVDPHLGDRRPDAPPGRRLARPHAGHVLRLERPPADGLRVRRDRRARARCATCRRR